MTFHSHKAYCNICERVRGGIVASTDSGSLFFVCESNHRTRLQSKAEVINSGQETCSKIETSHEGDAQREEGKGLLEQGELHNGVLTRYVVSHG